LGDISYDIIKVKFAAVRCEASVVYPFKQANPCNHRIVCSNYKKLLGWMVWSVMKSRLFCWYSWCWSSELERGDANMWILFKLAEALTYVYAEMLCAHKRGNRLIDLHCWDDFWEITKKVRQTSFYQRHHCKKYLARTDLESWA